MSGFWPPPPPETPHYLLCNVRIPPTLCDLEPSDNGWCQADLLIKDGRIAALEQAGSLDAGGQDCIDADHSILISGLVDSHVHLDKAHVSAFANFTPGTLHDAIEAMAKQKQQWTAQTLARRVEYSLQTAYAFGVRAMRSHFDYNRDNPAFIQQVLNEAADRWRGKVDLQLAPLSSIVHFTDTEFCHTYYCVAQKYGRISLFIYDQPDLVRLLTPVFEQARAQGWDIDIHVDEGLDPALAGLEAVTEVTRATGFGGRVLCGHCVALNAYDLARRTRVIARAVAAGLHFVALPLSNLYLQNRSADGSAQMHAMTPVAALSAAGGPVSMGADNVRDGFCAFGDFDPMAVLNIGAQLGHLHEPARDWAAMITCNPARALGLSWDGVITPGAPADLVLFAARNSGEISSRITPTRIVIRGGKWQNSIAPDFRQL